MRPHPAIVRELTRDVLLPYIAHALVCAPTSRGDALSRPRKHPLERRPDLNFLENVVFPFSNPELRWCMTSEEMVPTDPWLFTLLGSRSYIVFGIIVVVDRVAITTEGAQLLYSSSIDHAAWLPKGAIDKVVLLFNLPISLAHFSQRDVPGLLMRLARDGVPALCEVVTSSQVIAISTFKLDLPSTTFGSGKPDYQNWIETWQPDFHRYLFKCWERTAGA